MQSLNQNKGPWHIEKETGYDFYEIILIFYSEREIRKISRLRGSYLCFFIGKGNVIVGRSLLIYLVIIGGYLIKSIGI